MPDPASSPTCDTAGVIMPIISSISAIQVTEAIKLMVGKTDHLHKSLIQIDVWDNDWRKIRLSEPNPDCPTCGKGEFEFLDSESPAFSAVLCGRNAVQISPPTPSNLDLIQLAERLGKLGNVKQNEYLVRFEANGHELTVFRDARAIIKGTDDIAEARSLYARYVGT
jgi:adenylyltransferase/sulfurtransferase